MSTRIAKIGAFTRFVGAYINANIQGALEYRASFAGQVFAMLINDLIWLVFWLAYFGKFQLVAGWGRTEIVMLWAVCAVAFGIATTLCGNLMQLAGFIVRGELDFYLALPKPVLPHMLISRMALAAPGDILFGLLVFGFLLRPSAAQWAIFVVCTLTGASIFVAFIVITQSLAFWLGNAEGVSREMANALLTFSTYPTVIFRGAVKVALFTVLPAGFISYVPVQLLRGFSLPLLAGLLAFTAAVLLLSWLVFRAGLRRYESGNLVMMRD